MRAFLKSCINIYDYYRLFKVKKDYISDSRLYVYSEGQLLNGYLYLDSSKEEFSFGKCLPNIFYFDETKQLNKWHGLCMYRIMQLLNTLKLTESKLTSQITNDFKYDNDIIRSKIKYGLSHEIIESELQKESSKMLLKISEKGKLLLDYYFLDPHLLYYLALDTPVSKYANTKMRSHINDNKEYWGAYIECCIMTTVTFIRHIMTAHRIEIAKVTESRQHIYILPDYFPRHLVSSMSFMMATLKDYRDKSRYEKLNRDVQGF